MKIIFTPEAKLDLDELRSYLDPLSLTGFKNITGALEKKIKIIADNPNIGRQTSRNNVQEVIESKYGFSIPYYIENDIVWILRVYRSKRKPINYNSIKLP